MKFALDLTEHLHPPVILDCRLICISVEYAKAFYTAAIVDKKATVFALLACPGSGEPEVR